MDTRLLRVLIADNQPHTRSALRLLLTQNQAVAVVGEAGDMEQALGLAHGSDPDLALLEWELSGWSGASALAELRAARPGLAVIVLSGLPEVRQAALDAGADAFVSKGDSPEHLLEAVYKLGDEVIPMKLA